MATVEKKLKTLDVYLLYDGEKVTISDTADDNKATRALNEFKKYETMHYETEENGQKVTNAIPYHAVAYIEATESGGEPTGEVWFTGTLGECFDEYAEATLTETSKANTADLTANPTSYAVALNGIELQYQASLPETETVFVDQTANPQYAITIPSNLKEMIVALVACPTDITEVEVTVTKKGGGGSDN